MVLPSPILARKDFGSNAGLRLVAIAGGQEHRTSSTQSACTQRAWSARQRSRIDRPACRHRQAKSPTTIFPVDPSGGACSAQTRKPDKVPGPKMWVRGPSPAPRVGTGTVRRISNELGFACGRCDPGRGDFWILKIAHAPSPKNLSQNGLPQKRR